MLNVLELLNFLLLQKIEVFNIIDGDSKCL